MSLVPCFVEVHHIYSFLLIYQLLETVNKQLLGSGLMQKEGP